MVHDYISYLNNLKKRPSISIKATVVVSVTYCAGKSEAEK